MTTDTLERVDLEQLVLEDAPCDWTEGHRASGIPCSEVAVGLVWQGCTPEHKFRACDHAVAWVRWAMSTTNRCRGCNRPVAECWRSIPI